jgi:hypothetical protein
VSTNIGPGKQQEHDRRKAEEHYSTDIPPRLNHPYHLVEAMPCQLFDMAAQKPGNRVSLYHRTNDLFVCGLMPELCWNKNTHQP